MSKASRRALNGVLLLDKSVGESSNQALGQVKRLFNAQKAGHTGTLDPLAEGLLPLLFGEATKFAADLIDADKSYVARLKWGFSSSTGDAEGVIEAVSGPHLSQITDQQLAEAAQSLTGPIKQVPPMYSALKRDGKPLYEYARQGVELEREARSITVHQMQVERTAVDDELILRAVCSKGTYVRTLAEDFAKRLGCGAYLVGLRRTAIGALSVDQAHSAAQLQNLPDQQTLDAVLMPVDSLLRSVPVIVLSEAFSARFMQGQRLAISVSDAPENTPAIRVRVYVSNHAQPAQWLGIAPDWYGPQSQASGFLGTGILETSGQHALLRPDRLMQEIL